MKIEIELNGESVVWECEPHQLLVDLLRERGLLGTKRGCDSGDCGACSVLLDGQEAPSCLTLAAQASGHRITTIEGLGTAEAPHPIQQAFVDATAIQCGYCSPGMIIAAKALLDREPSPQPDQVKEALAAHPCRCTGHIKPVEAVLAAAERSDRSK